MIFLDHSIPAYIEYAFYSEFIQILKFSSNPVMTAKMLNSPSAMAVQAASESQHIPTPQGLQLVENYENIASWTLDKKALKNWLCPDSKPIYTKVKEELEQKPGKSLDEALH